MSAPTRRHVAWIGAAALAGVLAALAAGHAASPGEAAPRPAAEHAGPADRPGGATAPRRVAPPAPEEHEAVAPLEEEHADLAAYHPRPARPAGEWQGMLVDEAEAAGCEQTPQCGLARACRDGRCGACSSDAECSDGEGCVLDHCVATARIGCRSRADCGSPAEVCALSGYSADPRGNAGMRSYCLDQQGGTEQTPRAEQGEPPAEARPPREPSLEERLIEALGEG
jgi:hypothetical protein